MSITNIKLEEHAKRMGIPLVGVYNKDQLPTKRVPGGYIFNLQDSTDEKGNNLPGTHWTAGFVEGNRACYFDSFGFPAPEQVDDFLSQRKAWSGTQIQSLRSEVCGYYCLYFIWWMYKHRHIDFYKRFQLFLHQFSSDPKENLTLLKKYILPL